MLKNEWNCEVDTFSGMISGIKTKVKGYTPKCKQNAANAIKTASIHVLVTESKYKIP